MEPPSRFLYRKLNLSLPGPAGARSWSIHHGLPSLFYFRGLAFVTLFAFVTQNVEASLFALAIRRLKHCLCVEVII